MDIKRTEKMRIVITEKDGGAKERIHVMLMEALYGEDIFNWINNKGGN